MIAFPQMEQMDAKDLDALRELALKVVQKGCNFLEVGSWLGQSSLVLAHIAKDNGGFLFCIDSFEGNKGTILEDYARSNDVRAQFIANMESLGLMSNIVLLPMASDKAFTYLEPEMFDLIFIDANHEYGQVRKDILNSRLVIKEGGIICGHDYDKDNGEYDPDKTSVDVSNGVHCGVVRAVDEMIPDASFCGSKIWWFYED